MSDFSLATYDYTLPPELIAQEAVHPADRARLLVVDRFSGEINSETTYSELPDLVPANRIFFFNNSRVLRSRIPLDSARIFFPDGREKIQQKGEIFFLEMRGSNAFEALVRPGKIFHLGVKICIGDLELEVIAITESGRLFSIRKGSIYTTMEKFGQLPLPPYIAYDAEKEKDYQTVFAKEDGSVAAPTASLHFTDSLLDRLPHEREYVTLHVGLGTFKGISDEDIRDYAIHGEIVEVSDSLFSRIAEIHLSDKKILAVGTTVCRTLESLSYLWKILSTTEKSQYSNSVREYWDQKTADISAQKFVESYEKSASRFRFETRIYIFPGYVFRVVDELITNFHLPKSSLLVLISAFSTRENIRKIYQYAIREKYRFYSFGDGMYLRIPE